MPNLSLHDALPIYALSALGVKDAQDIQQVRDARPLTLVVGDTGYGICFCGANLSLDVFRGVGN